MIILQYKEYILIMTEKKILLFFLPLPRTHNNKLPDQLAFSLKSYTLCSEPELHIIEGIIVAWWWFEVADWLNDTDTYTYMNNNY